MNCDECKHSSSRYLLWVLLTSIFSINRQVSAWNVTFVWARKETWIQAYKIILSYAVVDKENWQNKLSTTNEARTMAGHQAMVQKTEILHPRLG